MSNQAYNDMYGAGANAGFEPSAQSQATVLDQMRGRLASLSEEARAIRAQVPHEFEPDVERIQQQMQRLGERLSDLSRGSLVPYATAQRAGGQRVKVVRYVTDEDVRVARAAPDEVIVLGSGAAGIARGFADDSNPWDDAAANALTELYESGEAYTSYRAPVVAERRAAAFRPQPAAAGRQTPPANRPGRSVAAGGVGSGAVAGGETAARGCSMDARWLDQRFADIAGRIEQSLAQIRPETVLSSVGYRFDQLEAQINGALGSLATRADVDELRAAEAQIEEIAGQLDQCRRQLQRLDLIDAHLGTLTSQLSDERLTRLFNDGVQVAADVGRLDAIDAQLRMIAVQLSDERLSGLVSRSSAHELNLEGVAAAAAERMAASLQDSDSRQSQDLGEVRGMIESLITERRYNDENNASMLETVQQAIIRVLDRLDSLEMAQAGQSPAMSSPAAYTSPAEPAAVPPAVNASYATADDEDNLVPPTARVYAEMPPMGTAGHFEDDADENDDMRSFRQDAEAESAARVPVYTTAAFDLDQAFSRARDEEAEAFGEAPAVKRTMEVLRHDFIADAHRAKLKAASRPDAGDDRSEMRSGELSVAAADAPAKPRRRSIFSFRSQRVAMMILVLLASIPAAVFFMPRSPAPEFDAVPTPVKVAPASRAGSLPAAEPAPANDPIPALPGDSDAGQPMLSPAPKPTKQVVPPLGRGEYEDVNANGAPIDTASLPDGISMQPGSGNGLHIAQATEQARMAYLSDQVGAAAARGTPAALLQTDADIADDVPGAPLSLPPPTVGPFSLRMAAAKGNASAQFEVASRLAEGKGTDQDVKDAARWYQRAAAGGFAMAQFRLGTLYERGVGVKKDAKRAQAWYERAAAQGNVKAMHNLAVLAAAAAPKADYDTAARWFTSASEFGLADSQFNLAVLYENGMGVNKSLQQAYKWMLIASKSGDKDAAGRLEQLKAKLSPAELAAAESSAARWAARPTRAMANDARLAGQAWQNPGRG